MRHRLIALLMGTVLIIVLMAIALIRFLLPLQQLSPQQPSPSGQYITSDAEGLARYLVEHDLPSSECSKLESVEPFAPPSWSKRIDCISYYARLTKDASVCESLLSGQYGLPCLGGVSSEVYRGMDCITIDNPSELICGKKGDLPRVSIPRPQPDNCSSFDRQDMKDWCHSDRTLRIAKAHDCSRILSPHMRDRCEANNAYKHKDAALCSAIADEHRQILCRSTDSAWLAYPALRGDFEEDVPPKDA
jgi:hypothetical protein